MIDRKKIQNLIPWYVNGTLRGTELAEVEDYVTNDPEGRAALKAWLGVRNSLRRDLEMIPPTGMETQIIERIRPYSAEQLTIFHPYALGLSLVILVLLWMIIRPGVTLEWRMAASPVTGFRVYRGEAGSNRYYLLDELPVNDTQVDYSYVDLFYWPYKKYTYYVEGMNQATSLGTSQVVTSQSLLVLPGQIALVGASFSVGYGIILLVRYRRILLIGNLHGIATSIALFVGY